MIVQKSDFDGLFLITPDIFKDERGYFFESYNFKRYADAGLKITFVQDNESVSVMNVVRGLHFQVGESAQGKLVSVVKGRIFDVAVDLRINSSTFGKYFFMIIDGVEKKQIYIPPGFAHGFASLEDHTVLHYKCTSYYEPKTEFTLLWNDPTIGIKWPLSTPIISEKDRKGKTFDEIKTMLLRGEI